jgi:hypothetical protein
MNSTINNSIKQSIIQHQPILKNQHKNKKPDSKLKLVNTLYLKKESLFILEKELFLITIFKKIFLLQMLINTTKKKKKEKK